VLVGPARHRHDDSVDELVSVLTPLFDREIVRVPSATTWVMRRLALEQADRGRLRCTQREREPPARPFALSPFADSCCSAERRSQP
jgi:hypothetical protein